MAMSRFIIELGDRLDGHFCEGIYTEWCTGSESATGLLAGLSILLNRLQLLSEYTPEELTQLATSALDQLRDV